MKLTLINLINYNNLNFLLQGLNGVQKVNKRPKRGLLVFDPAENEFDTEKLYRGMIMLTSDYSKYYYK